MTSQAYKVLLGFAQLSEPDQEEVLREMADYRKSDRPRKLSLKESYGRSAGVYIGPTSGQCPCCGR